MTNDQTTCSCGHEHQTRRGVYLANVAANDKICDEHYRIILRLDSFPPSKAGQFVQVMCRSPGQMESTRPVEWNDNAPPKLSLPELTEKSPLLRRPLSLAGRRDVAGGVELEIIYRVVGGGTGWLAKQTVGGQISVLGPLGNGFEIFPDKPLAAVVGGGVGIPPMLYLSGALAKADKKTAAFCGVRSANLLPLDISNRVAINADQPARCVKQFDAAGAETLISTDDGSLGMKGFASVALERWLDKEKIAADKIAVYCCGPEPLMKAIGNICVARNIRCQLSLERNMACGMGTCQSCAVKIRDDSQAGWKYKLCCSDGPVFDATTILW